jgi:hypothetical protein
MSQAILSENENIEIDQITHTHQRLIEISIYLGVCVGEYNSKKVDNFLILNRYTLEYCKLVKQLYDSGEISADMRDKYYANLGRMWSLVNY